MQCHESLIKGPRAGLQSAATSAGSQLNSEPPPEAWRIFMLISQPPEYLPMDLNGGEKVVFKEEWATSGLAGREESKCKHDTSPNVSY